MPVLVPGAGRGTVDLDREAQAQRARDLPAASARSCPPLRPSLASQAREPKAVMKIEHLNATFQPAKIGHPHGLQVTYLKDNSTRNIFIYHEDGKVGARPGRGAGAAPPGISGEPEAPGPPSVARGAPAGPLLGPSSAPLAARGGCSRARPSVRLATLAPGLWSTL